MSENEPVYGIIQKILDKMEPQVRERAEELLDKAKAGQKTDHELLILLQQDELLKKEFEKLISQCGVLYGGLPGDHEVKAHKYVCPECDYTWYRRQAGESPPKCPVHRIDLKEQC